MSLLISLLILVVVIYVVNLIIGMLNLPDNIKQIFLIIFGLIILISLLGQLGIISTAAFPIFR